MKRFTDELIRIKEIETDEDKIFLENCIMESSFQEFIGNVEDAYKDKYKLLSKKDKNIGCFSFKIDNSFGIKHAEPNLFVKSRLYSMPCIFKMIGYLFLDIEIQKIMFKVLSNNGNCLKLMERMNLTYNGSINNPIDSNGGMEEVRVFSITKDEFNIIRGEINEEYA